MSELYLQKIMFGKNAENRTKLPMSESALHFMKVIMVFMI